MGIDEILKEVKIPAPINDEKSTYHKLKERGAWDFALVSAALNATISGDVFKDLKIVLGGVAPIPWRLEKAENMIKGEKITENLLRQATREALKEAKPLAENGYKKELVEAAVYRASLNLISH